MSIEHAAIPDGKRHEPKGISTAASGDVYVADGLGSGSWVGRIGYGQMNITNNTATIAVTAASDPSLHTDTDFVKATGAGAPWTAGGSLKNITFATDKLSVTKGGIYMISTYVVISHSVNNAFVGIRYAVNDTVPYVPRTPAVTLATAGKKQTLSGFGITASLNANDTISLYVASDSSGNITIVDAAVSIILLEGN